MPPKDNDGHLDRRSGDGDAIRRNGAGSTAQARWSHGDLWLKIGKGTRTERFSLTCDACGRAYRAPHQEAPFRQRLL